MTDEQELERPIGAGVAQDEDPAFGSSVPEPADADDEDDDDDEDDEDEGEGD